MSLAGYHQYGERFLDSFNKYWPVPVTVYSEDTLPVPFTPLDDPEHQAFLSSDRQDGADYRWQAKRFSYKVFSILDAAKAPGKLLWLDADVVTHKAIPMKFLNDLLPKGKYIACLERVHAHSECGFVMYDCDHLKDFMAAWRHLYVSGEVYGLKEWHDSYVFDHLKAKMKIPSVDLSGSHRASWHPFINSCLGKYMDHLKGNRKKMARSPANDLVWARPEGHWK